MQLIVTRDIQEETRRSIKDPCIGLFRFGDDREMILMSQTPPSLISLIGEYKEWLVFPFLCSCISNFLKGYFQELGKRCAGVRKNLKSQSVQKIECSCGLKRLSKALFDVQHIEKKLVSIKIGTPLPGRLGNITLCVSCNQEEQVVLEIGLFTLNIEHIHKIVLQEQINPVHGVHLKYSEDYESVWICWCDQADYTQKTISIPLRYFLETINES